MVRIIDKLIAKGFIGPYILFFFIVEFVLVMQFLWKYIDEILGKGFTIFELLQMIFYYGVTIIPMAVPLTILVAAVMVYGDLSEKYELVSMKSSGLSLVRILRAGIFIAILTSIFSIIASNYLKPIANFKFQSTFVSLRKKKPTLSFEEGIFNTSFKGYTIRVGTKGKDNISIGDVLVYDHRNAHNGETNVISAKNGEMYTTSDGNYFIMKLYNGEHVQDVIQNKSNKKKENHPFMRTKFDEWTKVFDMSVFDQSGNININRNKHDLLNSAQILEAVDSIDIKILNNTKSNVHYFSDSKKKKRKEDSPVDAAKKSKNAAIKADKFKKQIKKITKSKTTKKEGFHLSQVDTFSNAISLVNTIDSSQLRSIISTAFSKSKSVKDRLIQSSKANRRLNKSRKKYLLRLHQQYSWAFICIIFLFIGAPLGSIVKKGGFGFPVLIAISFFIAFILLMITGEKLLKAETLGPQIAAWLPCIVLFPVSILVTYVALKDLKFYDLLPKIKRESVPIELPSIE